MASLQVHKGNAVLSDGTACLTQDMNDVTKVYLDGTINVPWHTDSPTHKLCRHGYSVWKRCYEMACGG